MDEAKTATNATRSLAGDDRTKTTSSWYPKLLIEVLLLEIANKDII
ncbi:MAG: hypothetical protein PUP93_23615 [Rhizonema sp. NSF051]|nr:hypothetical protein [Rhizonema sp. NSF051]